MKIAIAGCGALGSRLAFEIAHPDHEYLLIDDDTVEAHNVGTGTSIYSRQHIGAGKATVLAELIYRRAQALSVIETRTLTANRTHCLEECDLVVVTFDNADARNLCYNHFAGPLVQVGVSQANTGQVTWRADYTPLPALHRRGEEPNPVCTAHLGRHLIRFTAAVAAGLIEEFLSTGRQTSVLTLVSGGAGKLVEL